jgi:hypothetical protein
MLKNKDRTCISSQPGYSDRTAEWKSGELWIDSWQEQKFISSADRPVNVATRRT